MTAHLSTIKNQHARTCLVTEDLYRSPKVAIVSTIMRSVKISTTLQSKHLPTSYGYK